jgi:hypothetical protein
VSFKDVKNDDLLAMVSTNRPVVYASGAMILVLNGVVLKPLYGRYTTAAPVSVDFNAMLMINNNFEIEECIELIKRLQQWQVLF